MLKRVILLACFAHAAAFSQNDIFDAVYSCDTNQVKTYLGNNGDINVTQQRSIKLSTGKRKKTVREVSLFDAALLSIRLSNEAHDPKRSIAAYRNYELLIGKFDAVIYQKEFLDNMLGVAVATGDVSLVRWILERGADINKSCEVCYGRTPTLIAVAYNSNLEMIKFLLSQKPDLSIKDNDGRGYLHYASRNGNLVLLDYLLALNVELVDITDYAGMSPIFDAVIGDQPETYNYLLEKGAKTNLLTLKGKNLLDYAAATDNLDFFRQVYFTTGLKLSAKEAYRLTFNPYIVQFLAGEELKQTALN